MSMPELNSQPGAADVIIPAPVCRPRNVGDGTEQEQR
jgi:hypothetical protein